MFELPDQPHTVFKPISESPVLLLQSNTLVTALRISFVQSRRVVIRLELAHDGHLVRGLGKLAVLLSPCDSMLRVSQYGGLLFSLIVEH